MGRGATKNQYVEGNCLKRGPWIVYRFKVDLAKKREGVLLRGWEGSYPNVHYVCEFFSTSCKDFPDKTVFHPLNTFLPDLKSLQTYCY